MCFIPKSPPSPLSDTHMPSPGRASLRNLGLERDSFQESLGGLCLWHLDWLDMWSVLGLKRATCQMSSPSGSPETLWSC